MAAVAAAHVKCQLPASLTSSALHGTSRQPSRCRGVVQWSCSAAVRAHHRSTRLQPSRAQRPAGPDPDDLDAQREALNRMLGYSHGGKPQPESKAVDHEMFKRMMGTTAPATAITGKELRRLVYDKWGKSYDVRLIQRSRRMYLHVMWKFLEQQSFPLTDEQYQEQLDAIAEYINMWGVSDVVRSGILNSERPPHVSRGTGKAVQIILGDNLSMLETGS